MLLCHIGLLPGSAEMQKRFYVVRKRLVYNSFLARLRVAGRVALPMIALLSSGLTNNSFYIRFKIKIKRLVNGQLAHKTAGFLRMGECLSPEGRKADV